ncbi:two-component sensor histidine kinase [Erythrobacter jejuensis]|uniref:histidine kinase n=2 Tax=Parerythrobacter jejuensis TaxID=795812 RepID=A0A845AUQ4_9SPHN|nr:two-component sensor histidine kinase [Parerythrobacter jejuensis]
MASDETFPWPGIILAAGTTVILAIAGLGFFYAVLLLIVWIGSLWLVQPPPTDLAKAEAPSAFSREGMADMIEHSGIPLMLSERGRIIIANRAARELLGAHIIGQDSRVAMRHPEAIALMDRPASGEATVTGLVRPKDIWKMSRYRMNDDVSVIELVSRTAEVDISRAHTDFVANASHELRTPLASIIGYVETLSEDPASLDTPIAAKFLDTIHREGRRLQSLVGDLMSLSRIEAEKHESPSVKVELRNLVERAAKDAASTPDRAGRLEFDLARDFQIAGDVQQLEQMIRNLVDNAFKYGHHDTPVRVSLSEAANGDAKLEVADQGEGIPDEHIPHLTRRFYRTDPGRSRASGGTGLGLAIVKHIVQRHRGRLDIESKAGVGTVVTARIPQWRDDMARSTDPRSAPEIESEV